MSTTCAIYTRISLDMGEVKGQGVARQEEDCRKYAARHGYSVSKVYSDNDISASVKSKKERPEYSAMLAAAANGDFAVIVAYSNSRLTRRLAELEDLIQLHERHKTLINTVVSGQDDLSTADGRMVARIKASVDSAESERMGERVSRAKLQKAQTGIPLNARWRLFGYDKDYKVIATESSIVEEAFNRLAAGHSVYSIHQWINSTGNNPVTGSDWKYNTVLSLLSNPRYAGFNTFKAEIIGEGLQEPIITRQVWDAANANRHDRNKVHGYGVRNGANARKGLLTGFVYCGECLTPMNLHSVNKGKGTIKAYHTSYRCTTAHGGCGKSGMKMEWVDDAVSNALINALRTMPKTLAVAIDYTSEINDLESRKQELMDAYRAKDITTGDMLPLLKGINKGLDALQIKQQDFAKATVSASSVFFPNYKSFHSADLSQKRALMAQHIKAILIVASNGKGNRTPDHHRVTVSWSTGEDENLGVTGDRDNEYNAWLDGQ